MMRGGYTYLDYLKSDTGNVTDGVALAAEPGDKNLILQPKCLCEQNLQFHHDSDTSRCLRARGAGGGSRTFSSTKLRQPSHGTNAAIFLPFLMSCTRTHFRIAEFGCFASMPIFSSTMPLAWDVPPKGLAYSLPKLAFL